MASKKAKKERQSATPKAPLTVKGVGQGLAAAAATHAVITAPHRMRNIKKMGGARRLASTAKRVHTIAKGGRLAKAKAVAKFAGRVIK
jgi:hypothetical protein